MPPQRTTTQVITLGQYLEPDFDPNSLTVPLLFGILAYHDIKYPTRCLKKELVQLFIDRIKSRATELRMERSQQNIDASVEGIKDGLSGVPLSFAQYVTVFTLICTDGPYLSQTCWACPIINHLVERPNHILHYRPSQRDCILNENDKQRDSMVCRCSSFWEIFRHDFRRTLRLIVSMLWK